MTDIYTDGAVRPTRAREGRRETMGTFNTYKTTFNGEPEIHQNKRDALRAAKIEAKRTGESVKVEILTHAGIRWSESAVVVRRESISVTP